jgi:hypothetical protein
LPHSGHALRSAGAFRKEDRVQAGLAEPVRQDDRSYRGFNLLSADDLALFVALTRGEGQISDFRNATACRHLACR